MGTLDMFTGPILVTGATGYVGGRLVPRLLQAGYAVRAIAMPSQNLRARISDVSQPIALRMPNSKGDGDNIAIASHSISKYRPSVCVWEIGLDEMLGNGSNAFGVVF